MVQFDEIPMCPSLARKWEIMQCDAQFVLRRAFEDALNNPERVRCRTSQKTRIGRHSCALHTIYIGYVTFTILVLQKGGEILVDLDLNDGEDVYVSGSITVRTVGSFEQARMRTANDN
jgi:hypothetical protein